MAVKDATNDPRGDVEFDPNGQAGLDKHRLPVIEVGRDCRGAPSLASRVDSWLMGRKIESHSRAPRP